jgi:hypothetical protein
MGQTPGSVAFQYVERLNYRMVLEGELDRGNGRFGIGSIMGRGPTMLLQMTYKFRNARCCV